MVRWVVRAWINLDEFEVASGSQDPSLSPLSGFASAPAAPAAQWTQTVPLPSDHQLRCQGQLMQRQHQTEVRNMG